MDQRRFINIEQPIQPSTIKQCLRHPHDSRVEKDRIRLLFVFEQCPQKVEIAVPANRPIVDGRALAIDNSGDDSVRAWPWTRCITVEIGRNRRNLSTILRHRVD